MACKNYTINQQNRVCSLHKWLQHYLRLTEKGTSVSTWLIFPEICMLSLFKQKHFILEDPPALKRTQYLRRHEEIPEKTKSFLLSFLFKPRG